MATKLLDETRIRSLHQAALDAGLASQRADLLRGLDASFVASLPVSSSLSAQLFTDLHELLSTVATIRVSPAKTSSSPRATRPTTRS